MAAPSKYLGPNGLAPIPSTVGDSYLSVSVKYKATRNEAYYSDGNSRMRWIWSVSKVVHHYRLHPLDTDREDMTVLARGESRIKLFALRRAKRAARLIDGEVTFQTGGSVEARIARLEKELSIGS